MKLYDLIKQLLTESKNMRNSDKLLMWAVWEEGGFVKNEVLTQEAFFKKSCPTPESVTRARRKVQENHPELQATQTVKDARAKKETKKGNFVYQEKVGQAKPIRYEFEGDTAIPIYEE